MSRSEQQVVQTLGVHGLVTGEAHGDAVQSKPSLCMSHAATELSTPPLMAMSAPGRREVSVFLSFCSSSVITY